VTATTVRIQHEQLLKHNGRLVMWDYVLIEDELRGQLDEMRNERRRLIDELQMERQKCSNDVWRVINYFI
jgi:hypothetical protein